MTTKLGRVVTYGWKTSHTKLHDLLTTWSRDKYKILFYTSAVFMTTNIGRVVTCGGGTTTSISHNFLIMWSRDKLEKLISALPQYLWPPNLAEWLLTIGRLHPLSHVTLSLCGHMTNEKKLIYTLSQYLWPPNLAEW